ncbi:MAG TPA: VWA domain-containing protein [Acidobacteriaceae bacterium]|nr:VWA domain-containing protein [Acidobacteriaceae bacterium]
MPTRSPAAILGLALLYPLALRSSGHSTQQAADNTPALTLHAESRIVLADVTVTDRHGNPVHGLSAADFQVFDNNQPQRIASFDEHNAEHILTTSETYTTPPPQPNTATNIYQHLPPVLNVVLLDTTNLELPDQMYLHIQLTKFIKSLPAGQPIAIFARHGDYMTLLQPFTSNHSLLQSAIDRAIPRIVAVGREYRSDTDTLRQIGLHLRQVPGRKNVLWFTGGSTAYLLEGLSALTAATPMGPPANSAAGAAMQAATAPSMPVASPSIGEGTDNLREVYDELEAARVAIYPIDARGLTTEGDVALGPQQSEMMQTAEATGGEAIINRNSLALAASHILSADSSSYTLTWSPQNFHYDNKWHNIRIAVRNRDYHLSYRRGYFADKPQTILANHKLATLIAGDSRQPVTAPDVRSTPLLFQATVHPASDTKAPTATDATYIPLRPAAPPAKGTSAFRIDYSLSTAGLSTATTDGHATVFFAAIALDSDGNRIGQTLDRVRFPLAPGTPTRKLQVEQQINLPKGGDFLALTVWDPISGHLGTLQIPVTAKSK